MAGIGFELKRILRDRKLTSVLRAFGYSAMLSSGPYFISILSIIFSGWLAYRFVEDKALVRQFQVSVTYLVAFSLVYAGFSQFVLSRYVSDRIFEKRFQAVLPNFMGALVLNMLSGFIICAVFVILAFKGTGTLYSILFLFTFTTLCGVWTINILLTSLKSYRYILYSFLAGYGTFLALSYLLAGYGLRGLMSSFLTGQAILMVMLSGHLIRSYRSEKIVDFDFTRSDRIYPSLILTGFLYNTGVWADKFVFWFNEATSESIIGPLRASVMYDIPVFLAYLTIAPGMASLFLKVEGEFAEVYDRYYKAVTEGATLDRLYSIGDEMVDSARTIILDVLRVQAIGTIFVFLFERLIFRFFGLSLLYIPLFNILSIGTFLQLMLMSILALAFYFDKRREALILSGVFFFLNLVFSQVSISLGPYYYGYGFVLSLLVSSLLGVIFLRRFFNEVHYQTFMLH